VKAPFSQSEAAPSGFSMDNALRHDRNTAFSEGSLMVGFSLPALLITCLAGAVSSSAKADNGSPGTGKTLGSSEEAQRAIVEHVSGHLSLAPSIRADDRSFAVMHEGWANFVYLLLGRHMGDRTGTPLIVNEPGLVGLGGWLALYSRFIEGKSADGESPVDIDRSFVIEAHRLIGSVGSDSAFLAHAFPKAKGSLVLATAIRETFERSGSLFADVPRACQVLLSTWDMSRTLDRLPLE
jgi:hypothetical protein